MRSGILERLDLRRWGLLAGLSIALAAGRAPAQAAADAGAEAAPPKPAEFDSWSDRLDYIHDEFHRIMQARTAGVDEYFSKDLVLREEVPPSRFRVGLYGEVEVGSGWSFSADPDFEAEVKLPNLEKNWRVFLTGRDLDELPGTDPTERERGALIGVSRTSDWLDIDTDVGVRVRWLPVAFFKLKWRKVYEAGGWFIAPNQQGFYETDDGFGEVSSLQAHRWFGDEQRGFFRNVSALRWTEETKGVEWEQTMILGLVRELIEEDRRGSAIRGEEAAQGIGVRATVNGHKTGSGVVDRYRFMVVHRRPLYGDWMFAEIAPEVRWANDNDWDEEYLLRLGVDMLFWGSAER